MRPGFGEMLIAETSGEVMVATIALGVSGRDPALWVQASEAFHAGYGSVGFEGDEVPAVLDSLVDLGSLNSAQMQASEIIRRESNAPLSFLGRRAALLHISDCAAGLLHGYVSHPGFVLTESSSALKATVTKLQDRQAAGKYLGNRR